MFIDFFFFAMFSTVVMCNSGPSEFDCGPAEEVLEQYND